MRGDRRPSPTRVNGADSCPDDVLEDCPIAIPAVATLRSDEIGSIGCFGIIDKSKSELQSFRTTRRKFQDIGSNPDKREDFDDAGLTSYMK